MKNYYAILEIPVGCPVSEIRDAYRRLVQENLWNKESFAELREAYEVLTVPSRRDEYDKATFGETFSLEETAAPVSAPETVIPGGARHCPMGAATQCPVINARVPLQETYCPECGFLLATVTTQEFEPVALPDQSRQPRLEDTSGRRFLLRPGLNTVGREAADVLLPDKTVSRRHAQITVGADGTVLVEDLDSTNGTQVAGDIVRVGMPHTAADGARVQFGTVEMVLRLPAAPTNTTAAAPAPAAPAARVKLVSTRLGEIREFPLVPGVTTFGRRTENSVVLAGDPYISGYHAQIIVDSDGFRLTDLGSTNGTMVNGETLTPNEPRLLVLGDEIVLGSVAYRLERVPGAPDVEPTDKAEDPEIQSAPKDDPEVPAAESPAAQTDDTPPDIRPESATAETTTPVTE